MAEAGAAADSGPRLADRAPDRAPTRFRARRLIGTILGIILYVGAVWEIDRREYKAGLERSLSPPVLAALRRGVRPRDLPHRMGHDYQREVAGFDKTWDSFLFHGRLAMGYVRIGLIPCKTPFYLPISATQAYTGKTPFRMRALLLRYTSILNAKRCYICT